MSAKTEIITVRLTPEVRAAAELVGQVTSRPLANLMEYALRLYIEKNYPAALKPGAKVVISLHEAPDEPRAAS